VGSVPDDNPQQLIDLHSPSEIVKKITSINTEPGVEVKVTIADAKVNYFTKFNKLTYELFKKRVSRSYSPHRFWFEYNLMFLKYRKVFTY
jgi:hypothetical protein